jgi:hypothetical protein
MRLSGHKPALKEREKMSFVSAFVATIGFEFVTRFFGDTAPPWALVAVFVFVWVSSEVGSFKNELFKRLDKLDVNDSLAYLSDFEDHLDNMEASLKILRERRDAK